MEELSLEDIQKILADRGELDRENFIAQSTAFDTVWNRLHENHDDTSRMIIEIIEMAFKILAFQSIMEYENFCPRRTPHQTPLEISKVALFNCLSHSNVVLFIGLVNKLNKDFNDAALAANAQHKLCLDKIYAANAVGDVAFSDIFEDIKRIRNRNTADDFIDTQVRFLAVRSTQTYFYDMELPEYGHQIYIIQFLFCIANFHYGLKLTVPTQILKGDADPVVDEEVPLFVAEVGNGEGEICVTILALTRCNFAIEASELNMTFDIDRDIYRNMYIGLCYRSLFRNMFPRDPMFYPASTPGHAAPATCISNWINGYAHMGNKLLDPDKCFTETHIEAMVQAMTTLKGQLTGYISAKVASSHLASVPRRLGEFWTNNRQGQSGENGHLLAVRNAAAAVVIAADFAILPPVAGGAAAVGVI
jgi:hypothetical protein